MNKKKGKKKIIYIANIYTHHKIFNSFLIRKMAKRGYHVIVVSREDVKFDIKGKNVKFYNWNLSRTGVNPIKEFLSLLELIKIIKKEKPDIIHNFTIKANIYGTIAGKIFSRANIINTVLGLGHVYTETSRKGMLTRSIIKLIWSFSLRISNKIIFMNNDDRRVFSKRLIRDKMDLIPGHGVDFNIFSRKKLIKRNLNL